MNTWLVPAATSLLLVQMLGLSHSDPVRIVSVVPAITETLFAIGAGPKVVGVSSFDAHPAEVATRARVGGLLNPDLEQILTLRPDLVILYASQQTQIDQLTRSSIPVFRYEHGGLADTLSAIRRLGTRTGHSADAERLVDAISARLEKLKARVRNHPRPRVLLIFGREPLSLRNIYASGGVGFLHDILEAAGGHNVFSHVQRESVQLTSEAILTAAPEVIVELTYDERMNSTDQAAELEVWNRLQTVPAVQNRRIHLLLGSRFVIPGPRLADTTTAIAQVIHPGAFREK